jgi:hypothetical protein
VKPYYIRTTVISPGAVATELPNSINETDVAGHIQNFYEEYAIPADSFARAVAFTVSQPEEVDIITSSTKSRRTPENFRSSSGTATGSPRRRGRLPRPLTRGAARTRLAASRRFCQAVLTPGIARPQDGN